MARPGNRKLPAAPSRINRRWTAGDVCRTLSQGIPGKLPVASVGCTTDARYRCLSSFLVRTCITPAWNRPIAKRSSTCGQFTISFSSQNNRDSDICSRFFLQYMINTIYIRQIDTDYRRAEKYDHLSIF